MPGDPPTPQNEATQFAVLLFTDICDSTALKAKQGALAYKSAAELHNALFERIAAEEKLTLIKNTGDGYFARTTSVAAAARFALRFQHGMRTMAWPAFPLTTRVGIHAGEVADITTLGQADVLAPAADLVARVMSLAVGGQILLTRWPFDEARHFVREHPAVEAASSREKKEPPPLTWLAHGPYLFKGCEDPVDVFEVGAADHAPLTPPPNGEKAKRAVRPGDEETLGWRPACGLEVPGRPGWTLARRIGEGGFGEVWLAEQAKMKQRRVFKFCFDEDRLRSFKRELTFFRLIRDALGERNDIARLYDVKLDAPPFFLESEYAEHGNLIQWTEKQGGIGAVPMEKRLELVAQIAEAVAAAHSVGILHKDLKPQNVLMQARKDGAQEPQLTDFGIGALADQTALANRAITAAGFTVNTLVSSGSGSSMTRLYAPPEQLAGKTFTMQGDVYALGVILYQMVIGDFTRALAPGWEREVKDEIVREDLAECLDGEPARRLASAVQLAERLRSLDSRRAIRHAEDRRRELNIRRKRNARIVLFGGAAAAVIAVALSVGFFRERGLRQRADKAEKLANARLHHAEEARDAAETLVNEAVFGLREKLLPLGKINVLESLASAAEDYYAKLPPELVSDKTRRHEVWLALNRAIIAHASSDDEATEAALTRMLTLSRALSAKAPEDESLREDQYLALTGLAALRYGQERPQEMGAYGEQLTVLATEWLTLRPKAPGALRAKLASISFRVLGTMSAKYDKAALLTAFTEAQGVVDELKQVGGETVETRVNAALNIMVRAMMLQKLGQSERAVKLFAESDAAFRDALAKDDGHAFVREVTMIARKWSLGQLATYAKEHGDVELEKEAYRQFKELIAEQTALAEFEPSRLERWKQLGWLYQSSHQMARKFDGNAGWLEWLEKSLAASERAVSPRFDRLTVRRLRINTRLDLCEALRANRPAGWQDRSSKLLGEVGDFLLTPTNSTTNWQIYHVFPGVIATWRDLVAELASQPDQRARAISEARSLVAFSQRMIDACPNIPKCRSDAAIVTAKAAEILRQQNFPEADELLKTSERWRRELKENYADDPFVIHAQASEASSRGFTLLNALRDRSADKVAAFAALEKHCRESLAYLAPREAKLNPYDFLKLRGDCHAALGHGQIDQKDFAGAEASFRASHKDRSDAATKTENVNDATERRWDAADAQARLGHAVFKQGRKEEGRKHPREAAEAIASIAVRDPRAHRLRRLAVAWRECAALYDEPQQAEEQVALLKKSAAVSTEIVKKVRATPNVSENEKYGNLNEAANTLLEVGWRSRGKDNTLSEAALRESLGYANELLAMATPANRGDRLRLVGNVTFDLARTLDACGRAEAARECAESLPQLLQQVEAANGPTHANATSLRNWMDSLNKQLAK